MRTARRASKQNQDQKKLISRRNEAKEIEWWKIRYPPGEDFSNHEAF